MDVGECPIGSGVWCKIVQCGGERERKVKSEGCAERNKNSSSMEKFIGDLEMVAVKESNGSNSL